LVAQGVTTRARTVGGRVDERLVAASDRRERDVLDSRVLRARFRR